MTRGGFLRRTTSTPLLVVALIMLATQSTTAVSQTCEDGDPTHAATLIERIRYSCEKGESLYSADLYGYSVVAGEKAKSALKTLADWPGGGMPAGSCYQWEGPAKIALAKLGDEQYRGGLRLEEVSFIADDHSLLALIEFLIAHANDPEMVQDFGDYSTDYRDSILHSIDTIRRRRRVPDLPMAGYSSEGIAQWKGYLEKHRSQQLTFPVYPNVSDPYLQCLARRVDWGYPDAILAIAAKGGPAAIPILRQFPQPWKQEAMGFATYAPFNPHWSDIQGNLQVALAQLGDKEMFDQIVAGLQGWAAYYSVRKLEFIGGRRAVDALIAALDVPEDALRKDQARECENSPSCFRNVQEAYRPIWGTVPYSSQVDRETCATESFHACVLGVLGLMVKNPPHLDRTQATAQDIQIWKDWWQKNKSRAEFVVKPEQPFE
jgi:hypothetical protein